MGELEICVLEGKGFQYVEFSAIKKGFKKF